MNHSESLGAKALSQLDEERILGALKNLERGVNESQHIFVQAKRSQDLIQQKGALFLMLGAFSDFLVAMADEQSVLPVPTALTELREALFLQCKGDNRSILAPIKRTGRKELSYFEKGFRGIIAGVIDVGKAAGLNNQAAAKKVADALEKTRFKVGKGNPRQPDHKMLLRWRSDVSEGASNSAEAVLRRMVIDNARSGASSDESSMQRQFDDMLTRGIPDWVSHFAPSRISD